MGVRLSEFVTITYRALAERLGISLGAAKARVRRARWSVSVGNDGVALVRVPADDLRDIERATDRVHTPDTDPVLPEKQPVSGGDAPDTAHLVSEALRLLEAERERSVRLEEQARDLSVRLAGAEARLEAERARAERAEAALRSDVEPGSVSRDVSGPRTFFHRLFGSGKSE